jgi:hypothetical protein
LGKANVKHYHRSQSNKEGVLPPVISPSSVKCCLKLQKTATLKKDQKK